MRYKTIDGKDLEVVNGCAEHDGGYYVIDFDDTDIIVKDNGEEVHAVHVTNAILKKDYWRVLKNDLVTDQKEMPKGVWKNPASDIQFIHNRFYLNKLAT